MTYARDGYRFYRISTPSIFREYELPVNEDQMTELERRRMEFLIKLAELHNTHIECSPYRWVDR
jgi:hypothetical protein